VALGEWDREEWLAQSSQRESSVDQWCQRRLDSLALPLWLGAVVGRLRRPRRCRVRVGWDCVGWCLP